jgi:hypothetical protein
MFILHCLQVHRLVWEYVAYYNQTRPHQGIEQQIPDWYEQDYPLVAGPIIATPVLILLWSGSFLTKNSP